MTVYHGGKLYDCIYTNKDVIMDWYGVTIVIKSGVDIWEYFISPFVTAWPYVYYKVTKFLNVVLVKIIHPGRREWIPNH